MPKILAIAVACGALAACDVSTQTTDPRPAGDDVDMASPVEADEVDTSIFEAVPAQP
jgi:hypothetical protein